MSSVVEPLEPRQLFAASAALVLADNRAANAQIKVVNADLSALTKRTAADQTILKKGTRRSTAANRGLVTTLVSDQKSTLAILTRDTKAFETLIKRDSSAVYSGVKRANGRTTSTTLQAKQAAAIAKFNADIAGREDLLANEAATLITKSNADLNLLAASEPSTQPAVTQAQANVVTGTEKVQGDLSTLFRQLNTFITDASA